MSAVSIREALLEDAEELGSVHTLAWQETYGGLVPQSFLDSLDPGERSKSWRAWLAPQAEQKIFVAVVDGRICGFARGGRIQQPVQDPSFDAELYAINLIGGAKRKGTGTLLVHRLAQALRDMGLSKVVIWVLSENASARRFYERLGAEDLGQQKIMKLPSAELVEVAYGWRISEDSGS